MTDPTHTTNEQIALKLGWLRLGTSELLQAYWDDGRIWLSPDGSLHTNPPDFEHDWAHAGPLLEELLRARFTLRFFKPDGYIIQRYNFYEFGRSVAEVSCRAWLAWKKEEK